MSLPVTLLPSFGPALVVGGGTIAARKCAALVEGGFEVTVIAPAIEAAIRVLPGVRCIEASFAPGHLDGFSLVLACTDDREVNRTVGLLCRERGVPVLVADRAEEGTLHMPAVLREGEITVAVSTGGRSPRMAARVRDRLRTALAEFRGVDVVR